MNQQEKKYVKNPKSGRSIVVGGPTYNKLIREGILSTEQPVNTSEFVIKQPKKKTRVRKDNVHQFATNISTKVLRKHHNELKHLPEDELEKALEKLIIAEMTGPQPEKVGLVYGTGRDSDGDVKEEYESSSDSESESSEPEPPKRKSRKKKHYVSSDSDTDYGSDVDSDFEGY